MKLDDLADEYRLNLAVPDIAEEVQSVSGKEVDFRPTPGLDMRARTKMARQGMPRHVILFNPKEQPHLSHILAHECIRILRMFEHAREERQVAASTAETLRIARDEIRREAEFVPAGLRDEMVDMWIHGLITQVTSQPVDVRIEQWISDNYPGLREEQKRSLRTEVRIITASISPDVKRTAPAAIFKRSHALNYAYLDQIGAILGRSFESKFRASSGIVASGRLLSRIIDNEAARDREIIDECAEAIRVNAWFVWVDFAGLPMSSPLI